MTLSACLVCRFAKCASAGQVFCRLNDQTHETMHVCLSFVALGITEGAERYVLVTRTETAKSGRNCTSRTAA